MVSSLPLVMVIDADEIHREMLENMLEDDVSVISMKSAEECLQSLPYKVPEVIIIDPHDENIKGFELITSIREQLGEQACSIIVLTNEQSFDTRLKAYEAGANDFLTKPFQPEELLVKVNLNLNTKKFCKNLKQSADEAMEAALTAMKQSSDLGLILRFMEEAIAAQNHNALATIIHQYMQQFGVESSVMVVVDDVAKYFYCDENSSESQLMAMCREKGRIVDVGLVTVINGSLVSILVKEMPKEEARYGEIKDILGIMINLADVRARSIITAMELTEEKQFGIQASVKRGLKQIDGMQANLAKHTDELHRLMQSFRGRIQHSLLAIGATEDQEETFLEMVDDSLEQMEDAYNGVIKLESDFKALIAEMGGILQRD